MSPDLQPADKVFTNYHLLCAQTHTGCNCWLFLLFARHVFSITFLNFFLHTIMLATIWLVLDHTNGTQSGHLLKIRYYDQDAMKTYWPTPPFSMSLHSWTSCNPSGYTPSAKYKSGYAVSLQTKVNIRPLTTTSNVSPFIKSSSGRVSLSANVADTTASWLASSTVCSQGTASCWINGSPVVLPASTSSSHFIKCC